MTRSALDLKIHRIGRHLGARLKTTRKRRKLTINDISYRAGLSEKTYRRLESGEMSVSMKHFLAAALILDLDLSTELRTLKNLQSGKQPDTQSIADNEVDF